MTEVRSGHPDCEGEAVRRTEGLLWLVVGFYQELAARPVEDGRRPEWLRRIAVTRRLIEERWT